MTNKKINSSRRRFINNGLKTAGAISFIPTRFGIPSTLERFTHVRDKKPTRPIRILILGGTSFLGPHQIAYALGRGHKITTFTRGKTKPTIHTALFDQVEQLVGDRENDLSALKGRAWDAVIDNSGRRVQWTAATADLLKDKVGLYAYTSTVSVFYPYYKANAKEGDDLVLNMPDAVENNNEKRNYEYGVMKANSELEARKHFGDDRAIIVRPTFMIGPADRTDRFMYYPTKLASGGDIIVPGRIEDPVQFIDVRDIAEFMVRLIENKTTGTFNGVGPASRMSLRAYVHGAHAVFNSKVNYHYIDDYEFLESSDYTFQGPWVMDRAKYHGIARVNNELAIKRGLTFRPLADTIRDTYDWWYSDAVTDERRNNFDSAIFEMHNRQHTLLEAWKNHKRQK